MDDLIPLAIAAIILGATFLASRRVMPTSASDMIDPDAQSPGAPPPISSVLGIATSPDNVAVGPSYFLAAQPYYFAPPVMNMMPKGTASNTIASNSAAVDDGCSSCRG